MRFPTFRFFMIFGLIECWPTLVLDRNKRLEAPHFDSDQAYPVFLTSIQHSRITLSSVTPSLTIIWLAEYWCDSQNYSPITESGFLEYEPCRYGAQDYKNCFEALRGFLDVNAGISRKDIGRWLSGLGFASVPYLLSTRNRNKGFPTGEKSSRAKRS